MPGTTNCRRRARTKALTHSLIHWARTDGNMHSFQSVEGGGGRVGEEARSPSRGRPCPSDWHLHTFILKDERADPVILSAAMDQGRPRAEFGCCSTLFWRQGLCAQAGRLVVLVSTRHCNSNNYDRLVWHICALWLPYNARILQHLSIISELAM